MSNSSSVQFIKLNKSGKGNMAQRLGIPMQRNNLKRTFAGVGMQIQPSRNKVTLFDARQKLLKKKPMDARARLLAKKRLAEAIGIDGIQDARMKLQAKQKIRTKAIEANKLKQNQQILQQNQYSFPTQNYVSQEFLYQQPFQLQQPLVIPQQQQPMFQQQQQVYPPGIYNVSGTLLKTIQGQQNMVEYPSQPAYLKNVSTQKDQVKRKNIIRLKPITAPSPAPSSTQNTGTTIHETQTNFTSGGWVNGSSSNTPNNGWNVGLMSNAGSQDSKVSALDRIAPNSGVNFSPVQSYKVVVSNLAASVTYEDVEELFGSIGQIKRIRFTKPRTADIFFVDRANAVASVNKYHNRELDGLPMSVVMAPNQPLIQHHSNIPEVKNLLNNKSKVMTIDISPSIVHNALFKPPYTSGKDVKFTVRM